MKKATLLIVLALAAFPAALQGAPGQRTALETAAVLSGEDSLLGRDWIVKAADNICGLSDPNQLTHPAVIDFDACLEATQEMRRIRDQGIDPRSAEGIQLRSAAVSRLARACEAVRSANGHCSVWKAIRHKDGRSIPDVSDLVKAHF